MKRREKAWLVVQQECVEERNRPTHRVRRFAAKKEEKQKGKKEETRKRYMSIYTYT